MSLDFKGGPVGYADTTYTWTMLPLQPIPLQNIVERAVKGSLLVGRAASEELDCTLSLAECMA